MKKIVFITPLCSGIATGLKNSPSGITKLVAPLGVVYLFSALRKKFPDEQILHLDFNMYGERFHALETAVEYGVLIREILSEYGAHHPDVFCISLNFTVMHPFVTLISNAIRDLYPKSIICCGGAHASAVAEYLLEESKEADYVLCGEGEETLPELIEGLLFGKSIDALSGVHYRDHIQKDSAGSIMYAPLVSDIELDFTSYDYCLDMKTYVADTSILESFNRNRARSFTMMASRGCPGRCSYSQQLFCMDVALDGGA